MLLEIVVSYQFIHILLISGSLEKKHEALLFRGDAIQIFKILIMKFMLLEIVVFCQFIHILLISGYMKKNLNLYCLGKMLLKFLKF